jgi:hypothetical protein
MTRNELKEQAQKRRELALELYLSGKSYAEVGRELAAEAHKLGVTIGVDGPITAQRAAQLVMCAREAER